MNSELPTSNIIIITKFNIKHLSCILYLFFVIFPFVLFWLFFSFFFLGAGGVGGRLLYLSWLLQTGGIASDTPRGLRSVKLRLP